MRSKPEHRKGRATLSSLILVVAAFRQVPAAQKIDELTVQRLNVVDADPTRRLVLSGKDRMHPGILDGKMIDRARPVAGLADAAGKPRLNLRVDAAGQASIEFLDGDGKLIQRIPAK